MRQNSHKTEAENVSPAQVAMHGLTGAEYKILCDILARPPNLTELGIFSVMWSEHCSYKSSRVWLEKLPTDSPHVICGPGENAGIVDIGDGEACVFKIESHNHPSFIEPYQGAATGVGGIMRDVFTMGARPIANLDALLFGDPQVARMRYLVDAVVRGIGDYGNCFGVPTVGGLTEFDESYNGNILVNAMSVGLVSSDKIFYAKAAGVGNKIVYVGAKTGRDGVHGATMASAEFSDSQESRLPTVQVGDAFLEKLLLEACLELMRSGKIVGIQDMGAAGLTSSAVEMADKGGVGVRLDLDRVPLREADMSAYEIMLSESQERMLMVLRPEHIDFARGIFAKWDLDFAEIGEVTDGGHLQLFMGNVQVADIPVGNLVAKSPRYRRPYKIKPAPAASEVAEFDAEPIDILQKFLASSHFAHRSWIWRQYDHLIHGEVCLGPGEAAAAVVGVPRRAKIASKKAIAMTLTAVPRLCAEEARQGGAIVVAQAWRNLIAVGARPLAITNNLNFGNPEKPHIMGQFVATIDGMAEACSALNFPVVSGNVSLYNETDGKAIKPTPVIGGIGLVDDKSLCIGRAGAKTGMTAWIIGKTDGHALSASRYQQILYGTAKGAPPPLCLQAERQHAATITQMITDKQIFAGDAIADGGALMSLTKICLASQVGARLNLKNPSHSLLFGEYQGCYVIVTKNKPKIPNNTPIQKLATFGGDELILNKKQHITIDKLQKINRLWFENYMHQNH